MYQPFPFEGPPKFTQIEVHIWFENMQSGNPGWKTKKQALNNGWKEPSQRKIYRLFLKTLLSWNREPWPNKSRAL
jgi:hypothetical protein